VPRPGREHGFILIAALAVLLMLTLLSIGMFRSFGLEERITGNSREKQHAVSAAQSALQYAETWLSAGSAGQGTMCSMTSPSPTTQVCTQPSTLPQQKLATDPWATYFGTTYVAPNLTVNSVPQPQLVSSQYYQSPQYAITYLGADPSTPGSFLYQVTAQGFGGNANAVAVVQSVYSVGSGSTCVSCAH
jgi:type IV pilus assembly protein PilX